MIPFLQCSHFYKLEKSRRLKYCSCPQIFVYVGNWYNLCRGNKKKETNGEQSISRVHYLIFMDPHFKGLSEEPPACILFFYFVWIPALLVSYHFSIYRSRGTNLRLKWGPMGTHAYRPMHIDVLLLVSPSNRIGLDTNYLHGGFVGGLSVKSDHNTTSVAILIKVNSIFDFVCYFHCSNIEHS